MTALIQWNSVVDLSFLSQADTFEARIMPIIRKGILLPAYKYFDFVALRYCLSIKLLPDNCLEFMNAPACDWTIERVLCFCWKQSCKAASAKHVTYILCYTKCRIAFMHMQHFIIHQQKMKFGLVFEIRDLQMCQCMFSFLHDVKWV